MILFELNHPCGRSGQAARIQLRHLHAPPYLSRGSIITDFIYVCCIHRVILHHTIDLMFY